MSNRNLSLLQRIFGCSWHLACWQILMLQVVLIPAFQCVLRWVSQLADRGPDTQSKPDVKLNCSNPVCVCVHELSPLIVQVFVRMPSGSLLGGNQHTGNGPIAATVAALNLPLRIDSYEERSLGTGADACALAIVEAACPGVPGSRFGVGKDANIVTASVLAVLNAAMRFNHLAN